MTNIRKCAVIGCGNVGATVAYTLSISGLFSEMILIDADEARAKSEAMDLGHGLPFLSQMEIRAGDYDDLEDAAIVIIAAGAAQREGETRIDLLGRNVAIFRSIIDRIVPVNRECILLVLSNPVDILTYAALRLSGFPASRVIGSGTVLDTARMKFLVGRELGVDSRNVHSFIIGEHGDSEVPVWSSANVSGIDLDEYCALSDRCPDLACLHPIFEGVRDSAYEIIRGKGATYYGIAQATLRIVSSIVRDERSILPVSTLVRGHYGLDDVCLGVPCIVGREGVERVLDIPLSEEESDLLARSAEKLKALVDKLPLALGAHA